jgi:ribose transport system permease protein
MKPKPPVLATDHPSAVVPARGELWGRRVEQSKRIIAASGMVPALVLLVTIGAILSPDFLSSINLSNVLRIAAPLGLLAIGETLVILSGGGGIDLSVGTVMAASAVVGAVFQRSGLGGVVAGSLAAGGFFGLVSGLGVVTAGLQPFIVTLATLTLAQGVAFELTQAQPVILTTPGLSFFSDGSIGPVPVPIAIFVFALVIGQIGLSRTTFGRTLYAVGGNEEASYASGINVRAYRLGVYIISGLLAGLAGVLGTAQLNTADPNFGAGYELQAIAAVVVGGAMLSGGRGSIAGTGIGVLIMALVSNLLNLLNVNPWTHLMVTGLIVLVVVAINHQREPGARDTRVWRGLPLYVSLIVGALLLYFVLE